MGTFKQNAGKRSLMNLIKQYLFQKIIKTHIVMIGDQTFNAVFVGNMGIQRIGVVIA